MPPLPFSLEYHLHHRSALGPSASQVSYRFHLRGVLLLVEDSLKEIHLLPQHVPQGDEQHWVPLWSAVVSRF